MLKSRERSVIVSGKAARSAHLKAEIIGSAVLLEGLQYYYPDNTLGELKSQNYMTREPSMNCRRAESIT